MANQTQLRHQLKDLDGQSYKAYKSLKGRYAFPDYTLHIDHVQGDPFAAPSQVRIVMPQSVAQFPPELYQSPSRNYALADYLTRQFHRQTRQLQHKRGSGKSGLIAVTPPSQAVLPRTALQLSDQAIELRFVVGLPAFGRRIAGLQAADLLCEDLPELVERSLYYDSLKPAEVRRHVEVAEDADWLRQQLRDRDLVAFVADGAILPRRSGVDERPLTGDVTPFQAPDALRVSFECPNTGAISGLGIPRGITLIVGGGYHGKSTLLRAVETGIYNHVPGDGREFVVTDPAAVKVRAEDGRSVTGVDISPFINHLPQGKSTRTFSTPNASGSTSQAANIIEAVEAGAQVLLVDEDTSATNFMIRDRRMQALIAKDQEPITPFVDKVRQLYTDYGISTILVMGGSGDYFESADTVIGMDNYVPQDMTAQAQMIAAQHRTNREAEGGEHFGSLTPRVILARGIDPSKGKKDVSLKVRATEEVQFGTETIDLASVEQLVEPGQVRAIAAAIVYAQRYYLDGKHSLPQVLTAVMDDIEKSGLDCLEPRLSGELVAFRAMELAAALNRLRTLQVKA